jgi:hypothetical protein
MVESGHSDALSRALAAALALARKDARWGSVADTPSSLAFVVSICLLVCLHHLHSAEDCSTSNSPIRR